MVCRFFVKPTGLNFQTVCFFAPFSEAFLLQQFLLFARPAKTQNSSFPQKKKATTKALFFFSLFVVLFSLPKKKNNLKISITKVASLHHSFLENGSVLLDAV